ncbi:MAG: DUF433 domain-containing protein [Chitinophagales bacterium]|jgi:uncharacterized protein (DUF433 family)|nr:DUF433 domain-containing protein [Sphingobacteriales bacterium]
MVIKSYIDRITIRPDICHGKPVIRGMRYPVELILDLLGSGMTIEEILIDYSLLDREDILACIQYASQLTKVKLIRKIVA